MFTKAQPLPITGRQAANARLMWACQKVTELSGESLTAVAVARGCRHYASLWPGLIPLDYAWLPHEVLGCAMLRGPADENTFQMIRCGAMVLSDLGNSPGQIAIAAGQLQVIPRVAHIVLLGLAEDKHPEYWTKIRKLLPELSPVEQDFLPGMSRLMTETKLSGPGKGPERIWLRTAYSGTVR
jgi:hypothetical protein